MSYPHSCRALLLLHLQTPTKQRKKQRRKKTKQNFGRTLKKFYRNSKLPKTALHRHSGLGAPASTAHGSSNQFPVLISHEVLLCLTVIVGVAASEAVPAGVARGTGGVAAGAVGRVAVPVATQPPGAAVPTGAPAVVGAVTAGAPAVVGAVAVHAAVAARGVAGIVPLGLVVESHLGAVEGGEPATAERQSL